MDINNNQQTNTFLKGMNTDTSDMLLSSDQYRFAKNVRIVTNSDNNTGELRIVEGNEAVVSLPKGKVIAMDSIRDLIVVITQNESSWAIHKYKIGSTGFEKVFECTDHPINYGSQSQSKTIGTLLRWESEENIKLYIVDGENSLMSLLINKTYNTEHFEEVFKYNEVNLPAPEISVIPGGSVPSAVVLYAYRLYKENGSATTISALSEPLSLYKNDYQGFAPNKLTNKAVQINIGNISSSNLNKIQIYRIVYQQNGQLPVVNLILDQVITDNLFVDYGSVSVEQLSPSEFIALYNMRLIPKTIESKGDYLFLGGVSYDEDTANETFKDLDTRCFSLGNYSKTTNNCPILIIDGNISVSNIEDDDLASRAFVNGSTSPTWNNNDWKKIGSSNYNGIGKYFAWSYILNQEHTISPSQLSGKRSYKRGEIYRFGVRLFDKKGNASSVKWMCDILMPPMFDSNYNGINVTDGNVKIKELGIQFTPINTNDSLWKKVAAYEIVLCRRKLTDSYCMILGLGSKVYTTASPNLSSIEEMLTVGKYLFPTGFFTMDNIAAQLIWMSSSGGECHAVRVSVPSKNVFMFTSPEYVNQPDDIKDLLLQYNSNLYFSDIASYTPLSDRPSTDISMNINWYGDETASLFRNATTIGAKTRQLDDEHPSYFLSHTDGYDGYFISFITELYNRGAVGLEPYMFGTTLYTPTPGIGSYTRSDTNYTTDNNGKHTLHFFNYFYPDSLSSNQPSFTNQEIKNVNFVDAPLYSDFAKDGEFTFLKNVKSIETKQFVNWSTPFLRNIIAEDNGEYVLTMKAVMSNTTDDFPTLNSLDDDIPGKSGWLYPIGTGGKAIIFSTIQSLPNYSVDTTKAPHINVIEIKKPATPYGGYNKGAIKNSEYFSVGGYTVVDDNDNTSSVSLFSGDVFLKMFTYNALHEWYDSEKKGVVKMATVYAVPLETTIDLQALFSNYVFNAGTFNSEYVQDEPSAFDSYTQDESSYLYNTAYSQFPNIRGWFPDLTTAGVTNNFDTRVHFSERKINNESIDNWSLFRSSNFLDVDSRYGEITAMKLFKDKLIFWQDHATGVLSVNERVILNDMNNTQLQLGTGGVLERFDYISTLYGMKKNQHSYTESNNALYWWDSGNKEILQYSSQLNPLVTTKYIKNYINTANYESKLPTLGYDNEYKELVCNVINDESVVYNELVDSFISIYDEAFHFLTNVNGISYEVVDNGGYLFKHNSNQDTSQFFDTAVTPLVLYVVNKDPQNTKTFDIQTFGGRFYGGGQIDDLLNITFKYDTPLKQHSEASSEKIVTNREFDYRLTIPRDGETKTNFKQYGDRLKGKTMRCEISSSSSNTDFSLQYITTKYRMSWI